MIVVRNVFNLARTVRCFGVFHLRECGPRLSCTTCVCSAQLDHEIGLMGGLIALGCETLLLTPFSTTEVTWWIGWKHCGDGREFVGSESLGVFIAVLCFV